MPLPPDNLSEPVSQFARTDFASLPENLTIQQALDHIRNAGVGERIVYFYVLDAEGRLAGVLPTRRLLTAPLDQPVKDVMIRRVVAVPQTATMLDVCELFVLHKFLALPVVDPSRRLVGVVDVSVFTEELQNLAERERTDELFEAIGFHVSQVRDASPLRAFRFRFPWLLATIASGTLCALLAGAFELTLARSLVLAFFLTMVLGLGESVSVQSLTVTIQALRVTRPNLRWYWTALRREALVALLLGLACGLTAGLIAWLWRGDPMAGVAIGISVVLALCAACLFGLTVPAVLHALRLDPKIAAGPVALALSDLATLLCYFNVARVLLE